MQEFGHTSLGVLGGFRTRLQLHAHKQILLVKGNVVVKCKEEAIMTLIKGWKKKMYLVRSKHHHKLQYWIEYDAIW